MNVAIEDSDSIVRINELELDKECVKLPSHYLAFARQAADAKNDVAVLKAELDVIAADTGSAIRSNPEKYGLDKVTEKGIAEAILTIEAYQKGQRRVQKAIHNQELLQAVVWALEHKKRSLTLLVDLHGMGYFSSPKVSSEGRRVLEEQTKGRVRPRRDED